MKELSIEEKAKRYDEALKEAVVAHKWIPKAKVLAWLEKQGEQESAWSEEDEELLKWSINNFTELKDRFGEEYGKVGKCIDWVKSLKDRVQPQPKQEWSDEDETYLDHVFTAVKAYYSDDKGHENPWREELLRWLKLLKPQNIGYNPYKATVESIAKMCNKYKDYVCAKEVANDFLNNVSAKCREAIEYDKKYPQKQWKPSEEQMKALHDLNLTGCIPYAGQGQLLIGLYNDLKKNYKNNFEL